MEMLCFSCWRQVSEQINDFLGRIQSHYTSFRMTLTNFRPYYSVNFKWQPLLFTAQVLLLLNFYFTHSFLSANMFVIYRDSSSLCLTVNGR